MEEYTARCTAMQIACIVKYRSMGVAHVLGPRPDEANVDVSMHFLDEHNPQIGDYLVMFDGGLGVRSKEDFESNWTLV